MFNLDFNTSETPKELAYFLGFFWADGYNILKSNYCIIELVKEDLDDVLPIFKRLYNFNYTERTRKNRKPQAAINVSSGELKEFLTENGKYPKTSESHEKIMNKIPDEFLKYFIRGLFDGDGCFYHKGTMRQVYISGNYDQDWGYLLKYFSDNGFNFKEHKQSGKNKYSFIRCTTRNTISNFIHWLYDDEDDIDPHRKHDKAIGML